MKAKKLRKMQRLNGIEPHLDAKRRIAREAALAREKQIADAAAFRQDHPEEYARQQREQTLAAQRAMRSFASILGLIAR
jgi:hypothetical protein